jgi:general secretion pathway protein L
MRPAHEANVTAGPSNMGAPDLEAPRAAGVWTLAGDRLIINEPGGPATVLVPTEQVRLLAVDLPLANRAKRLAALPFAIEDQIAEPVESLHLALGEEVAPKRYLVGIVRHDVMARWTELADQAGLGHAAIVPDALALPRPAEGAWAVELANDRAIARAGDGTGFAIPASLLRSAWQSAGSPPSTAYGAPLPDEMMAGQGVLDAAALTIPALDLRQGPYARRGASTTSWWRRLAWIAVIAAAAHIVIAAADTLMLRSIADRRAEETRAVALAAAPGANLGTDLAASITDLLPTGSARAPDPFVPLLGRISGALSPLAGSILVRTISYQGNALTMDLEPNPDPGLQARIDAALKAARISATVTRSPDGAVRIAATGA